MTADETDLQPTQFSTDQIPVRETVQRWRDEFGRTLVRVDIEPVATDEPFKVRAMLQRLPGVGLLCCNGSAARVVRTQALAAGDDGQILNASALDFAITEQLPLLSPGQCTQKCTWLPYLRQNNTGAADLRFVERSVSIDRSILGRAMPSKRST